jgi:hypothetical protein
LRVISWPQYAPIELSGASVRPATAIIILILLAVIAIAGLIQLFAILGT